MLFGILLGITILVVSGLLFFAGAAGVAGGGGVIVAAIVLGAGLTLVASAFVRPLRWLIVPALALGLGAGTAVAAGVEDVGGSTGEKVYRPASASSILPHYELGAGHLVVDLRNADLTGEHRVDLEIGAGHAEILVPEGTCVAGDLHAGIGGFERLRPRQRRHRRRPLRGRPRAGRHPPRRRDRRRRTGCDHDRPRAVRRLGRQRLERQRLEGP